VHIANCVRRLQKNLNCLLPDPFSLLPDAIVDARQNPLKDDTVEAWLSLHDWPRDNLYWDTVGHVPTTMNTSTVTVAPKQTASAANMDKQTTTSIDTVRPAASDQRQDSFKPWLSIGLFAAGCPFHRLNGSSLLEV
jgi:hypothetical protein